MSETVVLDTVQIVKTPTVCFGKPRIAGTRMTVQFLATLINHPEWTVARICEEFSLTPAQVHAAWSYYYDHQDEIDAALQQEREFWENLPPQDSPLVKRWREMKSNSMKRLYLEK